MIQQVLQVLCEWCNSQQIRYEVEKCDNGHVFTMPILNMSNIIDMMTILRPLTEGEIAACHGNKDGNTLVWIGPESVLTDDQFKFSTDKMVRKQSAFRSSFHPSRSFGGITRATRKKKKKNITEEFKVPGRHQPHTILDVEAGQLIINDQTVINNHADLLHQLVEWLAKNDMVNLQAAIDDLGDAIKSGADFIR
jgi:hypothetical protein